MHKIICPYCCEEFMPDKVDFRLNFPLEEIEVELEGQEENEEDGMPPRTRTGRGSRGRRRNDNDGRVVDEKLKRYYINILKLNEDQAQSSALMLQAISVDYDSKDISFDERAYAEHGFVFEVEYRDQKLTERLCPYCHNKVVNGAGKSEMIMLSVIGDTNVGKTVFLVVLQEMIKQDRGITGFLSFMGTPEEEELYCGQAQRLIKEHTALKANDRQKVPPSSYEFLYRTADMADEEYKSVLIVFCDIAGEDCRSKETLERNGYHLKKTNGIIFLVDPTRFEDIKVYNGQVDRNANTDQHKVLEAINQYLRSTSMEPKIKIPTAIVVSKCDVLEETPYIEYLPKVDVHNQVASQRTNFIGINLHPGYLADKEIGKMHDQTQKFLEAVHQGFFITAQAMFGNCRYFFCSALGETPEITENENGEQVQRLPVLKPYRILDPFYWILAQNGLIPQRYEERWREQRSGEVKTLSVYGYCGEPEEDIEKRFQQKRLDVGIKTEGIIRKLKTDWKREEPSQD